MLAQAAPLSRHALPWECRMECAAAPPNKDSTSARVEIDVGGSSRCLTNSWHACCVAATCCVAFHNAATCCVAQRCNMLRRTMLQHAALHNAATQHTMLQHVACRRGCLTNSFGQTHPSALSARSGQPRRCEWRSVVAQRHCAHRMCTSMMICGALRGACCVPCAAWHKCCGMQRRTAEPPAGRPIE